MFLREKENKKEIQTREEILELEKYIRDFWQFSPLPVCYINPLNIVLDVSSNFESFSGYKATEIVGENLKKLFAYPREIEEIEKGIFDKGVITNHETTFLNKEKRKIPIILSAMVRKDEVGDIIGYFLSIMDVTTIKQSEEKLKKKVDELERYKSVTVDRELKMIELKKKIKRLEKEKAEL
ncbi:MAG: PAS domain S-box protein [Candidatus Thermoplasmatota archaeon]|nr:PAS domain S-box protein [Candidatus Thermoplasmatota archaeon]